MKEEDMEVTWGMIDRTDALSRSRRRPDLESSGDKQKTKNTFDGTIL